jgi:DNA polymerase III gamma/tau subunit
LSLFDQVLAFSGSEVKDEDVSALLGLVDRELLLRASGAVVSGDSLGALELVESLADYGADYRNFARELILHFRELLLLKVAPAESALLATLLPEERERLRPLADAFSEEDLLRVFETLTEAETELRTAPDPRVTLEIALLRLVQMRRLLPFAELVARVERMASGAAPPARPPATLAPPAALKRAGMTSPEPQEPPGSAPSGSAGGEDGAVRVLEEMIAKCATRPSLLQPLRSAQARLQGDTLVLEVAPDWSAFASMHADEYRDLARQASSRPLKVQIGAGVPPPPEEAPAPSPEEVKRQRLRQEAEREPAVQEALDLFEGKVVDVREAKPAKEAP